MNEQYEGYRQVVHHFTLGLYRANVGLALAPMYALPEESQQRFKKAGQDFTIGLTKLAQTFAQTLDQTEK